MKFAAMFSDHAVLQREKPIAVWGWAKPLAEVAVKLGKQTVRGLAGTDGKFMVTFPAMPASGPLTLEAKSGGQRVTAKDVWVGEVWLASGQSNMQFRVHEIGKHEEELELANCKNLRMINIPNVTYGGGRQSDVIYGTGKPAAAWQCADARSVLRFSAVASHFAKVLADASGVKVGVINSSWGGTFIEAWISRETLMRNPVQAPRVLNYEKNLFSPPDGKSRARPKPGEPGYLPADPGNAGVKKGWAKLSFNDAGWNKMKLPGSWTRQGHQHSGVFWFRKVVEVPESWAGKDLVVNLGAVDKSDVTYFNGVQIGAIGEGFEDQFWNVERVYKIPGKLVKKGRNVIAVRAYSFMYDGGLIGPETVMQLSHARGGGAPISIAGEWTYKIERNFGVVTPGTTDMGPGNPNTFAILFDNMIAPVLPYGIRGVIWYQGCSNTGRPLEYDRLMKDLVRDWRYQFGQDDFPFYITQLANFRANLTDPEGWPRLREAQLKLLEEPGTGIAVTIDIGESTDIHPKNKKEVGRRLALWALRDVHGKQVEVSGPLYATAAVEIGGVRVKFTHATGGLSVRGGELGGFTIADASKKFVPAKAVIDGESVVVSSPEVASPMYVRYAWSEDPTDANLVNGEGLPASPFRTDKD